MSGNDGMRAASGTGYEPGRLARTGGGGYDAEVIARVGWSWCIEPGDPVASAVIDAVGAVAAWEWLCESRGRPAAGAARALVDRLRDLDHLGPVAAVAVDRPADAAPGFPVGPASSAAPTPAVTPGPAVGTVPEAAPGPGVRLVRSAASAPARAAALGPAVGPAATDGPARRSGEDAAAELGSGRFAGRTLQVLARALDRWTPRLDVDPGQLLAAAERVGAVVLVPYRTGWPDRLAALGAAAPLCLWVRGEPRLDDLVAHAAALVGARAATDYGEQVAFDLAADLASDGVTVLSGGAYGIDAAAHRGALMVGSRARTVALLAGGPDRLTPAGNADLLRRVIEQGGAVVAESPPGRPPSRSRFLLRNRLIAALTGVTVVVEAGWRSGALNTARHAAELLRPVGAVPGPVTSSASAGCHRLLRDGLAVCVTEAADVRELLSGPASGDRAPVPEAAAQAVEPDDGRAAGRGGRSAGSPPPHSRRARVLDALRRHPAGVATVAARAGLAVDEVEAELGLLELDGAARRSAEGRWGTVGSGTSPASE